MHTPPPSPSSPLPTMSSRSPARDLGLGGHPTPLSPTIPVPEPESIPGRGRSPRGTRRVERGAAHILPTSHACLSPPHPGSPVIPRPREESPTRANHHHSEILATRLFTLHLCILVPSNILLFQFSPWSIVFSAIQLDHSRRDANALNQTHTQSYRQPPP